MNKLIITSLLILFVTGIISANISPIEKKAELFPQVIKGFQNIHFLILDSQTGERIEEGFIGAIGESPTYYGGNEIKNGEANLSLWIPFKYTFIISSPGYKMLEKTFYLNKKEIVIWIERK